MDREIKLVQAPYDAYAIKYLYSNDAIFFSTREEDCSILLKKHNLIDNSTDVLLVKPENTEIVIDEINLKIYCIYVIEGALYVESVNDLPDKFSLETSREILISACCCEDVLIVKTAEEMDDFSQKSRMYLVDLTMEKIICLRDETILESYCLPHILKIEGKFKIVIEDSVVFPFELETLMGYENDCISNKILSVSLDKLLQTEKNGDIIPWKILYDCEDCIMSYAVILTVLQNAVLVCQYDKVQNYSSLKKVNVKDKCVLDEVIIKGCITEVIKKHNQVISYIAVEDNQFCVYDASGRDMCKISLNDFYMTYEDIEVDGIIGMDNQRVFLEGIQYKEEKQFQVRIVYDIKTNEFNLYNAPFIVCENVCY